jgi:hypothetical protein
MDRGVLTVAIPHTRIQFAELSRGHSNTLDEMEGKRPRYWSVSSLIMRAPVHSNKDLQRNA